MGSNLAAVKLAKFFIWVPGKIAITLDLAKFTGANL